MEYERNIIRHEMLLARLNRLLKFRNLKLTMRPMSQGQTPWYECSCN